MDSPPRDRPSASRSAGLPGFVPAAGRFLSFDAARRAGRGAQHGHRQPLRPDVRRRGVPRPRPRAGAPGPPSRPPPPSTPRPPPGRTRPAAHPGPAPRFRPRTSGDAGYTRSSSSRTAPAGPATGTRPSSGGRSRPSSAGDHSAVTGRVLPAAARGPMGTRTETRELPCGARPLSGCRCRWSVRNRRVRAPPAARRTVPSPAHGRHADRPRRW